MMACATACVLHSPMDETMKAAFYLQALPE